MTRTQRFGRFRSDFAVGSTIGVAVMALSAVISAGALYASVSDLGFEGDPAPRLFDVESTSTTHHVRLEAGKPLFPGDATVRVEADGSVTSADLWEFHAPELEDGDWSVDEQLCVIGPDEGCLFSDGFAIDVTISSDGLLIFDGESYLQGGGGDGGGGGGGGYTLLGGESLGDNDDGLAVICHKPNTPAEKTKSIPYAALAGHTGHGDTIGPCSGDNAGDNGKLAICHKPGILDLDLTIGHAGWAGHEGHGDTVGAC